MPSTQYKTKEEYNEYFRIYREKNREKWRAYRRIYNKKYRKRVNYKDEKNYKKRNPEKYKAHQILNYAVRRGLIKRGRCRVCKSKNAQGHHPDHSKPLKVIWLCAIHHTALHRKLLKLKQNNGSKKNV